MTIHRYGNPESVIGGVDCIDCRMGEQIDELGLEGMQVHELRIAKSFARLVQSMVSPGFEDFPYAVETGADEAERRAVAHDKVRPDHSIVVYRFDKYHPFSEEEAATLAKDFGVKHVFTRT